jgi:hypothetical protein
MRRLPSHYLLRHLWLNFPKVSGIEYAHDSDASCRMGEIAGKGVPGKLTQRYHGIRILARSPTIQANKIRLVIVRSDLGLGFPTTMPLLCDQLATLDDWTNKQSLLTRERV